jgi:hypothetical protein
MGTAAAYDQALSAAVAEVVKRWPRC